MSHSSMLTTRRRNQARAKKLYRANKRTRRKTLAAKTAKKPS